MIQPATHTKAYFILTITTIQQYKDAQLATPKESAQLLIDHVEELQRRIDALPKDEPHVGAKYCLEQLKPQMLLVRQACDALELRMSREFYPFPTYQDLLYSHHVEPPTYV